MSSLPTAKPKVFLGIAGELVSGKSTASEFFVNSYNAEYYRFSKVLDKVLDILDLEHTRKNQQDLAVILKDNYGGEVLMNALFLMAEKSDKNFFVLDGFRKPDEVAKLKTQPNSYFLYIETPVEVRYQRMLARGEKVGETVQSFEEFKISQEHAADIDIRNLKSLADFQIQNDGTLEQYHQKLKEIGDKICL